MILLLLACSDPPKRDTAVAAPEVVQVQTGMRAEDLNALEDRMDRRLSAIEERIGNLELQVAELSEGYESTADKISLDPSATTLDAKDVQAAIVELSEEVDALQFEDMGEPGEPLFDIPKDRGDEGKGRKGGGGQKMKGHKAQGGADGPPGDDPGGNPPGGAPKQ